MIPLTPSNRVRSPITSWRFRHFCIGLTLLWLGHPSATAATYYVTPGGNDAATGTSTGSAWATLAKVSTHLFVPGDIIRFEGKQSYEGTLTVTASGTSGHPITYTSYGTGRASFASGTGSGLVSTGHSYISVSDLNFTGNGYTTNTGIGLDFSVPTAARVHGIRLDQLKVSGYGSDGIRFGRHSEEPTEYGYHGVQVTHVQSFDNKNNGLNASTGVRAATYTHSHFVIRDSAFYRNRGYATPNSSGNGLILGGMDGALIERCVAYENGLECTTTGGGPVGIWSWMSNAVIIQNSISARNGNAGLWDGGGFDIDGGNTNCVIQYCYSYDNSGAGYLMAQFAGAKRPARNNVIRYNLSVNDARDGNARNQGSIHVWNATGNTATDLQDAFIYGNTVYQSVGADALRTADAATTRTVIFNNVFVATNGKAVAKIQQSGGVTLHGNTYWGSGGDLGINWGGTRLVSLAELQALGQEKLGNVSNGRHADPLLQSPGTMPRYTDPAQLVGWLDYQLAPASPARDSGVDVVALIGASTTTGNGPAIAHPGPRDFSGLAVPQGLTYDAGALEHQP